MTTKQYTHSDYFFASLTRLSDMKHLRTKRESAIFSVYCAGVSIECMFRAYIARNTKEFSARHDLIKLFEKSNLSSFLDIEEKEKILCAIKQASKLWSNDLRYASEKRMKRIIAHESVRVGFKDVNKYIEKYYSGLYSATELIIQIGEDKWT